MNRLLTEHRDQILAIGQQNGVVNIRVFGSMARNDARDDSDVDLLVDLADGYSGFALGGFLTEVSELLQREVDVVTEKSLHPRIHDKVVSESLPL